MKERYFEFAKAASQKASYTGSHNFAPAIGAVAVYKGSILGTAYNSNKTSTLQKKYNKYEYKKYQFHLWIIYLIHNDIYFFLLYYHMFLAII